MGVSCWLDTFFYAGSGARARGGAGEAVGFVPHVGMASANSNHGSLGHFVPATVPVTISACLASLLFL